MVSDWETLHLTRAEIRARAATDAGEYSSNGTLTIASWWCHELAWGSGGTPSQCPGAPHCYDDGAVYTAVGGPTADDIREQAAEHTRETGHEVTFVRGQTETLHPMRTTPRTGT